MLAVSTVKVMEMVCARCMSKTAPCTVYYDTSTSVTARKNSVKRIQFCCYDFSRPAGVV